MRFGEINVVRRGPVNGDVRFLGLNLFAILTYTCVMEQLRHISIALACLVIALPLSVCATCCSSSSRSSECCSLFNNTPDCCCGAPQLTGKSYSTSTSGNQCDTECICSTDKSYDAILVSERGNEDLESAISLPFCDFFPSISALRKEFHLFACRPPSHNRRQALLCVWLK